MPTSSRRLLLASLVALAVGCDDPSPAPVEPPVADQAASPETTPSPAGAAVADADAAAAPAETASPPTYGGEDACAAAAFALPKGTVIATVDGEPIRAEALGDDAREAERDALHAYCREVHRLRESATQRAIEDHLLAKAARDKGVPIEQFVQDHLASKVARPDEAEIAAFYAANKSEQAPPFEAVRGQVEEVMIKERSNAVYTALIAQLRGSASVETKLPDVRPPALELTAAEHTATFGPADATLTIVEFSDFECPYCSRAAMGVSAVKQRFGDQVRFAFRHFPLSFHPSAMPAAEYSQCANEQGKFWAMHDQIFEHQEGLSRESLPGMAEAAGLDPAKLADCLESGRARTQVEADMAEGRRVGVRGTPAFYFNGRAYEGGTSPDELIAAIEDALRDA